ncbi:MAG: Asp-tRNA(Asn)/Glu-tRNA(Gln) amidotransferase subunit GatC [Oscillospiraceae bacterium]|jgi:aspartyl-tRNA(Asn)/glutamyl-tRNA(Gln) amidotransferase subunit C|nr:Asp-tRNA(Asn)/Glu-tRNA(Gln) amidotransferase subunit GatC [Oscillospiraceae bacterium]
MNIDRDLVLYLESLARIALSEEERAACEGDLRGIITYFDQLRALDTEGVEPLSHSFPVVNVMREDEVRPSMPNEDVLANAPRSKDGAFLVYRAVE